MRVIRPDENVNNDVFFVQTKIVMRKTLSAALTFFILLSCSIHPLSAQDNESVENPKLPSVGASAGILSFFGDIGSDKKLTPYSNFRMGYSIYAEKKFFNTIGISAQYMMGKLAKNERSPVRNFNFESKISGGTIGAIFHFDNDFILKSGIGFAPFLSGHVGFFSFKTFSDLKDKNGNTYFYWADGTIRNLAENDPLASSAKQLYRDYTYETDLQKLKLDSISYPNTTIAFAPGIGFNLKLSKQAFVTFASNYYFTQTDWIDDFSSEGKGTRKGGKGNDGFLYTYFGVSYQFGMSEAKQPKQPSGPAVDFASIDNADSDGDGVKDIKDECPQTPKEAKVDSKGCPIDTDEDGVPDYLDKEPNTKKGVIVDANGVELKENAFSIDSVVASSITPVQSVKTIESEGGDKTKNTGNTTPPNNTSPGNTPPASGASGMPPEFKMFDKDGDGMISSTEISAAIDTFFEGEANISVDTIFKLIDYFFEQ